jgi:hypothetical protein
LEDVGDFPSWCAAAVERVPADEARAVPYFAVAAQCYTVWWCLDPGRIPARQQLDPLRFGAKLLPHLTLIEAVDDGADYYWRLCGEYAAKVMGTSLVGKRISQIEADLGEGVLFRLALNDVIKQCEPMFYVLRHRAMTGCMKRSYGVLLPLREDAEGPRARPRYLLGACDWTTGE